MKLVICAVVIVPFVIFIFIPVIPAILDDDDCVAGGGVVTAPDMPPNISCPPIFIPGIPAMFIVVDDDADVVVDAGCVLLLVHNEPVGTGGHVVEDDDCTVLAVVSSCEMRYRLLLYAFVTSLPVTIYASNTNGDAVDTSVNCTDVSITLWYEYEKKRKILKQTVLEP
jgi:hypothetical protein